ncbi:MULTISPECIES: DUF6944 family repetitive protein [Peribacillus]|uniref:Uncharacterized protein n=1 Tax=Peribacillus simplex TaxID=1478 RepID=A0A9W4PL64_9BACI|nr:hypothetical protein [Peribacillus simplex]MDR4925372.1 hypothetical protein [Peribacillus simplex]WHX89950.1 hypothetical protein QNH50_18170 [Peribacillus simplex]CAH0311111.1 hypothetical protein SRABI133_04943 [Peribacillus simplex]
MDNQFKETFGSWIQAIGTVISAIAGTPSDVLDEEFRNNLDLIGNELQATGNALLADAEETWSLNKFGNQLQAIGNSTVILGLVIDFDEVTKQELIIKGNLIQALGGGTALAGAYENPDEPEQAFNVTGNLLQVIGNSMQAIGGIAELKNSVLEKDKEKDQKEEEQEKEQELQKYQYPYLEEKPSDAELIQATGGWVQAVGSVISLIGQLRSNEEENSGKGSSNESNSDDEGA